MASERFRKRIQRSGQLWRGCLDLAVERQGRLVGLIQARTSPSKTLPLGVFEIGVVLFRRQDHGKGYGREAVALLTTWLFDQAGAERVQAGTEVGNAAMRTVLERLGFRLEGIMRGYGSLSDGSRTDGGYVRCSTARVDRATRIATRSILGPDDRAAPLGRAEHHASGGADLGLFDLTHDYGSGVPVDDVDREIEVHRPLRPGA